MESNYGLYIKERENRCIYEDRKGFATYSINDKSCYIQDIFVKKEFRQENVASEYADKITEIARNNGCTFLIGSVCPTTSGSTESLKVLLGYGFKLDHAVNNMIYFRKEI